MYTDNFYMSPSLFIDLHDNGFDACGTVCIDRKGLTETFKKKIVSEGTKLFEIDINVIHHTGDTYCETIKNGLVTCLKWQDKREVKLLSTFHTGENTCKKKMQQEC